MHVPTYVCMCEDAYVPAECAYKSMIRGVRVHKWREHTRKYVCSCLSKCKNTCIVYRSVDGCMHWCAHMSVDPEVLQWLVEGIAMCGNIVL